MSTFGYNFKDVSLVGYLNNVSGTYISREMETAQDIESTKLYAEMNIPSGTGINWFASNDGGATWESMTIEDTRPINHLWTEYILARTFTNNAGRDIRFKAEMTGSYLKLPRINSIGATLS